MSMTLEEAIELLCYGDWLNVISEHIGKQDTERIAKAMCIVGKALRPVSRKQVEKVWRGEWILPIFSGQKDANDPRCQCSECGSIETPLTRHRFCPACGAAQTDEAMQMVMERLEALHSETKTD